MKPIKLAYKKLLSRLYQTPLYGCLERFDSHLYWLAFKLRRAHRGHTEHKLKQLAFILPEVQDAVVQAEGMCTEPLTFHYDCINSSDVEASFTAWIYNRKLHRHRKAACPPFKIEHSWSLLLAESLELLGGATPF